MKNKKIAMISIILIVIITITVTISILYKNIKEAHDFIQVKDVTNNNIVTLNNRPGIINSIEFNGLACHNNRLTVNSEICVFESDVINLTNNTMPQCEKLVIFRNKKGNEVGRVKIYLDELKPDEVSHFYSETPDNFKDAYTFEIIDLDI